jgi:1-acyl-sn-glycerol-3-phosphate acyltransferase
MSDVTPDGASQQAPDPRDPRSARKYYFEDTTLRVAVVALARLIFKGISVIHTSGVENLPARGGVVLAANHVTNIDVFPMQLALPRSIFFMAKAELHRNPLMDAVLRRLGTFPIERGAHDEWALQQAEKVLEHGQMLGIFPEGKRNQGMGLRPAKTGAARLAIAAGCPIVPLAVVGTNRMFKRFPRRTRVRIQVGAPIYALHGETAAALTDRLMFTLAEMLPSNQRGAYAHRPQGF